MTVARDHSLPRSAWRWPRGALIVFAAGFAGVAAGIVGARLADDPGWIRVFDNLHWTSGTAAAAALGWMGWRKALGSRHELSLLWFAVGLTCYAIGQIVWDIQSAVSYSGFPTPSDLFYLWLGPALCAGLLREIHTTIRRSDRLPLLLDLLCLAIAALILILDLYLPKRGELDLLSLTVLVAYPVTLIMAACTGLVMVPALRLKNTLTLWLFLLSVTTTAWSWMVWNLMALEGATVDGSWFNASFSIAVLVIGVTLVEWHPERSPRASWDRMCEGLLRLLPLMSVVAACGAVIVTNTHPGLPAVVVRATAAGSLAVIGLAVLRQAMTLKERDQLLLAQEEILRGRALLQSVIETVPIRVFWKDSQDRYLGCNAAFARDLGLKRSSEVVGKLHRQVAPQAQADPYLAEEREVMASGVDHLGREERLPRPDGSAVWHRISKVPLRDGAGDIVGVLGVYDDITERKQAEEERNATLRFFERMDMINRAIQRTDNLEQMLSDVLDGMLAVFECERAFLQYPCDPLATAWHVPMERTGPEHPRALPQGPEVPMDPEVGRAFRLLVAADEPVGFGAGNEEPLPATVAGSFSALSQLAMAIHPKGDRPYLFGVHQCSRPRSWTPEERKLLKEIGRRVSDGLTMLLMYRNLRESESRFRVLVNQAADAFFVHDLEGRFLDVNRRACESLGYTREELLAMGVAEVDAEFISHAHVKQFWNRLTPDHPVTLEGRHRRKDGSTFPVEVRLGLLRIDADQVILALARDITERKSTEAALKHLNEELETRVRERTVELSTKNMELERMNQLFVGRELRMVELKKRIEKLEDRLRHGAGS